MKKKITTIVAAVILIAAAGLYSFIDRTTDIYDSQIDSSDYVSIGLAEGGKTEQRFTSSEESLDGISVKLDASGNIENLVLNYKLTDEESGKVVAEGEASLAGAQSGKYFDMNFEQVTGCKGKEYLFEIMVQECDEQTSMTVYRAGEILVMRTIHQGFDVETFIITVCFILYIVLFMKWLSKLFRQGNRA